MTDWTVPDANFTPEQVRAARGILDRLGGTGRVDLAFLGGSLAVGLGHALSDIDLYVVGAGLPDRELSYQHDGTWVHVNPLSAGAVRDLVALGTWYRASGLDRSQLAVDQRTLSALVRLVTGWRLHAAPEWAGRLDALNRDTVRQVLCARNANVFSAYAEDACGALADGDRFTAATAARLALEAACEATLASAGDLYVGPKFLFRRLARTPVTAPWCRYLWRLAGGDTDPETIAAVVRERLSVGSLLLSWCAVDGWDRPLDHLPAPTVPPPAAGPRRAGAYTPIRFLDGWALIGPEDGYEVSEELVRLWRRLDGRPLSDIIATLPEAEPALAGHGEYQIRAAVGMLADVGAVEQPGAYPIADRDSGPYLVRNAPKFSCHPRVSRHDTGRDPAPDKVGRPC
ncbi:MAG TPA: hypothetical protein VGJ53_08285 [Micromonosporaceae bacterium]|jgi:hypothetical protein